MTEKELGKSGAKLADALRRWVRSGRPPSPDTLQMFSIYLTRMVRIRVSGLSDADASDVVSDVLEEFAASVSSGHVDPERVSLGYVLTRLRWRALDAHRRNARSPVVMYGMHPPEQPGADDAIVRELEALASVTDVVAAMRALRQAGDDDSAVVIRTWLDVADRSGKAPTLRQVAAELNTNHMKVARALDRFRTQLVAVRSQRGDSEA